MFLSLCCYFVSIHFFWVVVSLFLCFVILNKRKYGILGKLFSNEIGLHAERVPL